MIPISTIFKNIKNNLPYFLLILIYFFFINLEAKKDKYNNTQEQILSSEIDKSLEKEQLRLEIPVIPYKN